MSLHIGKLVVIERSSFSSTVTSALRYYVYRLIDPRKGDTFYVGKGRGNRVFSHIKGESDSDADELSDKLQIIRDIRRAGFEVTHVIHRHDLDEDTAFEVEAALIDAYPEVTNVMGGRASDERGLMHAQQIIVRYEAKEVIFHHSAVLINVSRSIVERESIYDAVRWAWRLDPVNASKSELVLAVDQGLIIGVFVAHKWLPATVANFPGKTIDRPGRWGFVGQPPPFEVANLYLRHRIPDQMRKKGASYPIRYAAVSDAPPGTLVGVRST